MIVLRLKFHGMRVAGPDLRVAVQKQAFVVSDPVKHLLSILFEQPQLEALVQLQFPHVPHLVEVLPGGVQPV